MRYKLIRYKRYLLIATALVGIFSLLTSCGLRKLEPASKEDVRLTLSNELGEEAKVVAREELPDTKDKFEIMAYNAYLKEDSDLTIHLFEYEPNNIVASERIMTDVRSAFGHVVVKMEVLDWIEEGQWRHDIRYSSDFLETEEKELNEKYETEIEINIYLNDIETEREDVAGELASVIKKILFSSYGGKVIVGRDNYSIFIRLRYSKGEEMYRESLEMIGTREEPLEISREGLIEAFQNSAEKIEE